MVGKNICLHALTRFFPVLHLTQLLTNGVDKQGKTHTHTHSMYINGQQPLLCFLLDSRVGLSVIIVGPFKQS